MTMMLSTAMKREVPQLTDLLAQVRAALRQTPARKAYLFGSWGRGEADGYSDLDIAVVCESARPFLERFRDFDPLYELPWPVDLLVYRPEEVEDMTRRGNGFMESVMRDGVELL
mgnify:CR=1 FL=1